MTPTPSLAEWLPVKQMSAIPTHDRKRTNQSSLGVLLSLCFARFLLWLAFGWPSALLACVPLFMLLTDMRMGDACPVISMASTVVLSVDFLPWHCRLPTMAHSTRSGSFGVAQSNIVYEGSTGS